MAKCSAGDAAMKVTTDAVQVFGGYGYTRDYPTSALLVHTNQYVTYHLSFSTIFTLTGATDWKKTIRTK
jgi:alkylation response protein AidB-like acyl-CoA dehydrogenase